VRKLMRGMHARRRRKWKTEMKKYKQRREQQRKSPQGLKPYINYVLQRPTQEEKPWVLMEETKEGETKVIDTKKTVEEAERKFTEEHMGKGRKRWYIRQGELIKPFKKKEGRGWRKRLQTGTMTKEDWKFIPKKLRYIYKQARAVYNKKGERMEGRMYGDIFTAAITRWEMDAYIARMRKNTAPGVSGIRIDHVAALPEEMRELIALAISLPYITGMGYAMWEEEIVNWVPKEEGNMDIKKRRPLMYYEVLRKLSVGIRVKKVLKVWRDNKIIDDDNYAFLTGRTTVQPLMIKK
jgi:hypothetical protein